MTPRDPGLQPERTALSWGRTGLSMAAVALLVIRSGFQAHDPIILTVGALDLMCALLLYVAGAWRRATLAHAEIRPAPAAWMAGVSAAVGIACLSTAWLVLR